VRRFHFYIDDTRCDEPRVLLVQARDERRAREIAERMLTQSADHTGVEVCENGVRLFGLGSMARRTWCERDGAPEPERIAGWG
jgi:hypothetical protein